MDDKLITSIGIIDAFSGALTKSFQNRGNPRYIEINGSSSSSDAFTYTITVNNISIPMAGKIQISLGPNDRFSITGDQECSYLITANPI